MSQRLVGCILISIFIGACSSPQIKEVKDRVELKEGKSHGTYEFTYTLTFLERYMPKFPINVYIVSKNYGKKEVFQLKVDSNENNVISADLKPGTYEIFGRIADKDIAKKFRDAEGPEFKIDESGIAEISKFPLVFQCRIEILTPELGQHFNIEEDVPCLKWMPIKEAAYYFVEWEEFVEAENKDDEIVSQGKIKNINDSEVCFHFLIKQKPYDVDTSTIQWELTAYEKDGFLLGRESGSFIVRYKLKH